MTSLRGDLNLQAAQLVQREKRERGDSVEGQDEVSMVVGQALDRLAKDFVSTADQSIMEAFDGSTPEYQEQLAIDIADRQEFSRSMDGTKLTADELRKLNQLVTAYGKWTVQALLWDGLGMFNLQLTLDEPIEQPLRSATWRYVPGSDDELTSEPGQ